MNSKLNSPYEINKNIQILKCDLSKFPNEELNNQVNKIQPPPKNDSHPQLLKDCYFCKEAIDHVCLKLFKNHKSCINCLNMTIANQKILKCSNCRKNYEIYRQKYEKNEILHMYDIKRISSLLLKNEAERKEMLGKEINGIDNSM